VAERQAQRRYSSTQLRPGWKLALLLLLLLDHLIGKLGRQGREGCAIDACKELTDPIQVGAGPPSKPPRTVHLHSGPRCHPDPKSHAILSCCSRLTTKQTLPLPPAPISSPCS